MFEYEQYFMLVLPLAFLLGLIATIFGVMIRGVRDLWGAS